MSSFSAAAVIGTKCICGDNETRRSKLFGRSQDGVKDEDSHISSVEESKEGKSETNDRRRKILSYCTSTGAFVNLRTPYLQYEYDSSSNFGLKPQECCKQLSLLIFKNESVEFIFLVAKSTAPSICNKREERFCFLVYRANVIPRSSDWALAGSFLPS